MQLVADLGIHQTCGKDRAAAVARQLGHTVLGAPVQRIVHASNELNYCARCQTGGKLLADRALSRLLKASWPKTLDDL